MSNLSKWTISFKLTMIGHCSVLSYEANGPRFDSWITQWNSIKRTNILFLIEDISELECWTLIRHLVIYESLSVPKKIWNGKLSVPKKNWNGKWFIEYIGQYLIPTDDSHGVYPVPERLWRSSKMREKYNRTEIFMQLYWNDVRNIAEVSKALNGNRQTDLYQYKIQSRKKL